MLLTKDDLNQIEQVVQSAISGSEQRVMRELAKKADKADVDRMEARVVAAIGLVERDHDDRLSRLEQRVGRLEQATGA